jgi:hypothetical protein
MIVEVVKQIPILDLTLLQPDAFLLAEGLHCLSPLD